jgi:hypothetical protein
MLIWVIIRGGVNMWRLILRLVILLLVLVTVHELTHYQIFELYNCTDIMMGVNWNGAFTSADCSNPDVKLPQAITEIVGYIFIPMFMMVSAFMFEMMDRKN